MEATTGFFSSLILSLCRQGYHYNLVGRQARAKIEQRKSRVILLRHIPSSPSVAHRRNQHPQPAHSSPSWSTSTMPPPLQLTNKNHAHPHSTAAASRQVQKRVDAAIGIPPPLPLSTQRNRTNPFPPRPTEFSKTLTTLLTSSSSPRDIPSSHVLDALLDEAKKHIEKLDLSCPTGGGTTGTGKNVGGSGGGVEADGCATRLWNLCTRLRREFGSGGGDDGDGGTGGERLGKLLLCGRVLGFYLLVVVRVGGGRVGGRMRGVVVHLVKLGLKVARDCVGEFSAWGGRIEWGLLTCGKRLEI